MRNSSLIGNGAAPFGPLTFQLKASQVVPKRNVAASVLQAKTGPQDEQLVGLGTLKSLENGVMIGVAASFLTLDRGGDLIAPGAFSKAIADFLGNGFITYGHAWDQPPIAMPISAIESSRGLIVMARFHESSVTQGLKAMIADRLRGGLTVGLSIGFSVDPASAIGFRSGQELLQKWPRLGFRGEPDRASVAAWNRPCRVIPKVETLYEVSLVSVPMNPHAHLLGSIGPV